MERVLFGPGGSTEAKQIEGLERLDQPFAVEDSGEREYTHVVATVTTSGTTTIHSPAVGKAVRLVWFYAVNDPTALSAPLIDVKLGSRPIYRAWALSKRQRVTGAVNAPLTVTLSAPGTVAVTALLEEI